MANKLNNGSNTNSGSNVTNDTISGFLHEIAVADREVSEATGRRRALLKRAKSEGLDLEALGFVSKAKKRETDEVVRLLRNTIRYSHVAKIEMSVSGLFDNLDLTALDPDAAAKQGQWAAEEAGFECGKANGSREDNPFPPGAELHAQWDAGFLRGKRFLAGEDVATTGKTASTRRGKNRTAAITH